MDQILKNYLRKLVDSVRKTIAEEPENIQASKECGEDALTGKWVDISLLCHVIEEEILK